MAGTVRPVVSLTSQVEVARPVPSSTQVAMSAVERTEGGIPEESFADVAIGKASESTSPAPSIARGAALEELPPQERSTLLEVDTGTSQSLVQVAALDEAVEERDWGSVHMEDGDAVCALTTMLSLMHDIVAPVGQV